MSDSKISALSSASTVYSGDYLLLTQLGNSVKIPVSTFVANIPNRTLVTEASESPVSGAIATNLLISKLTAMVSPSAYSLASGTHGMEKQIVVASCPTSASAVLTVSGAAGFTTITFNSLVSSAYLKNVDGLWHVLSNVSSVIV